MDNSKLVGHVIQEESTAINGEGIENCEDKTRRVDGKICPSMEEINHFLKNTREEFEERLACELQRMELKEKRFDKKLQIMGKMTDKMLKVLDDEKDREMKWFQNNFNEIKKVLVRYKNEQCRTCLKKEEEIEERKINEGNLSHTQKFVDVVKNSCANDSTWGAQG